MTSYLFKWAIASLLMPLLVLLFGKILNNILILVFWPGAIALMSLGAEKRPLNEVIFTWLVSISLNVVFYVSIGLVVHYMMRFIKS